MFPTFFFFFANCFTKPIKFINTIQDKKPKVGIIIIHLTASLGEVKFILPTCKTKVGTGRKRKKTLRSRNAAAPSINNLKRFTFSCISLDVKIIKKNI